MPGCTTNGRLKAAIAPDPGYVSMYGAIDDNGTLIPAVDVSKLKKSNLRQVVDYSTKEPVGTIVVDPMPVTSIW